MSRSPQIIIPKTQREALDVLTVDILKTLAKFLDFKGIIPTRKQELIDFIVKYSSKEDVFHSLSDIEKLALAETAHSTGGIFDKSRFIAKYKHESFSKEIEFLKSMSKMNLFIIHSIMPDDIREKVLKIFPKPQANKINCYEFLPQEVIQVEKHYNENQNVTVDIQEKKTEHAALQNLLIALMLTENGKIKISSSNRFPTVATINMLAGQLTDGDWYEQPCYEGIQAFALPLLIQSAGFAAASATSLSITSNGKKVLSGKVSPFEAIKTAWDSWKSKAIIDEFSRINVIKGQKSKGQVMTSASGRRGTVIAALSECPQGKWISIEELGRFMRAENQIFEVTHDPWKLYIGDSRYGSLGYDGYNTWEILQERYIKVFLMEYAATLGIIDIGITLPEDAASDFNHMWGTDDLCFLSRYDGLLFFRINDLGAYVLGKTDSYTQPAPQLNKTFDILPNCEIVVTDKTGTSKKDYLYLDKIARKESDFLWKISPASIKLALEKGEDCVTIKSFLQKRTRNEIPQTVEVLLQDAVIKIAQFSFKGRACLLECNDPTVVHHIRHDMKLKLYALISDPSHIIILPGKETHFLKRMRDLGYSVSDADMIV